MSTLTVLRTSYLNVELGLDNDSDNRFGDTATRESALQNAFRRIWPKMARYGRETVTLADDTYVYTLTELTEVQYLETLDSDGIPQGRIDNFRIDTEDTTVRLLLHTALDDALTCYAYGYAPYTVPASGAASSNLPTDLEWIIVQGARAELYRRLLNQFVVYERHENENRKTFLTPDQLIGMSREAEAMFQSGIQNNRRKVAVGRRGIPTLR